MFGQLTRFSRIFWDAKYSQKFPLPPPTLWMLIWNRFMAKYREWSLEINSQGNQFNHLSLNGNGKVSLPSSSSTSSSSPDISKALSAELQQKRRRLFIVFRINLRCIIPEEHDFIRPGTIVLPGLLACPLISPPPGGVVFINDYNCVSVTFPDLLQRGPGSGRMTVATLLPWD